MDRILTFKSDDVSAGIKFPHTETLSGTKLGRDSSK